MRPLVRLPCRSVLQALIQSQDPYRAQFGPQLPDEFFLTQDGPILTRFPVFDFLFRPDLKAPATFTFFMVPLLADGAA